MSYGFTITALGYKLLAGLLAGENLNISRVWVGRGRVLDDTDPAYLTDLVLPTAAATSTKPVVKNNGVSFIIEYRNDLNGGLTEGFWLSEYGVFAYTPEGEEILLYYGTLGDFPQYVVAYGGGAVDVRRFPVSITLSTGVGVTLDYPPLAFVTWEDLEEYGKRGVVFSATRPTGDWTLWLQDLGEIPNYPDGEDAEVALTLETAPIDAPGDFAIEDDEGNGETVLNMTDNHETAGDDDIIVAEQ